MTSDNILLTPSIIHHFIILFMFANESANNNMTGGLPSEIGFLVDLESLDLGTS